MAYENVKMGEKTDRKIRKAVISRADQREIPPYFWLIFAIRLHDTLTARAARARISQGVVYCSLLKRYDSCSFIFSKKLLISFGTIKVD